MKIGEFILPLGLALLGMFIINSLFFSTKDLDKEPRAGTEFIAPVDYTAAQPLNYVIDFQDKEPFIQEEKSIIDTGYGTITLSNYGAVIDSIIYKNIFTNENLSIQTLNVLPEDKENGGFLVALNGIGATPYYYNLVEKRKTGDITKIVYKAETDKAVIYKEFFIYDDIFKIDFKLSLEPKAKIAHAKEVDKSEINNKLQARILIPAPYIQSDEQDAVQGIIYTNKDNFVTKTPQQVTQAGWLRPQLFGTQDKYFVNSLVSDPQSFVKRAYFRPEVPNALTSVLEGPLVKENSTWNLSFYFGPKKPAALGAVDARLEDLLGYGWLWFISKPVLMLLNVFHGFLGNYGLAIIALTIFIHIILIPLTLKSNQNQQKTIEFQRKMKYIEQKYKHNPDELSAAKWEMTKKYSSGGALGWIALFLQMPIMIGLSRVLSNSIDLYKAPFFWIPDLSGIDPYYILPALFVVALMIQTMMSGIKSPPQVVASFLFTLLMGAILGSVFSAGLLLYIMTSTILRVLQTSLQKAYKI